MSIYYKRTAIEDVQRAAAYIRRALQNEEAVHLVTAFLVGAIAGLADAPCTGHPVSADLSGCTPCRVLTVPCFLIFFDFGLVDNMNKWLIDCERWAGWRNGLAKRWMILYN